jgi:hypothetical protein
MEIANVGTITVLALVTLLVSLIAATDPDPEGDAPTPATSDRN